jgi:hypothetical protein
VQLAPPDQSEGEEAMHVKLVKATARYSQDTGKGAWKSLELGAEADIAPTEDWQEAEVELYQKVTGLLRALWANGNGKAEAQEQAINVPIESGPASARQRMCSVHNQEWKPKQGKYGTFYSHKAPDGSWCNEKA